MNRSDTVSRQNQTTQETMKTQQQKKSVRQPKSSIRARRMHRALVSLFVFVPVGQDVGDPGRVRQSVHILKVLLGDLERTSSDVRNVLSDQLARVDCGLVDLLEEEGSERLDTGAEEGAVERHVDALEGDRGETALEGDGLRLALRLLHAFADDLRKV
jgi:hypothetical protein